MTVSLRGQHSLLENLLQIRILEFTIYVLEILIKLSKKYTGYSALSEQPCTQSLDINTFHKYLKLHLPLWSHIKNVFFFSVPPTKI